MKFRIKITQLIFSIIPALILISCNQFNTNTSPNKMLEITIKQIAKCPECNERSKTFTIKLKPGEQKSICGEEEEVVDGQIKLNHCVYEVVGEREISN
jgi:hypothetical protein